MNENRIIANNGSSIVLYTADDGNTQLEVKLEKDSVWLNREQIAQLYGRDYKTIAKHINNALREELEGEPVVEKFATPRSEEPLIWRWQQTYCSHALSLVHGEKRNPLFC